MSSKATATRERILRAGLDLMSRDGLSGVTLAPVAERVGISKSGLFAHFRSKDEMQVALLEAMTRLAGPHVVEPALQEPEGLPRLEALVRHWLGWSSRAGLSGGCPVAAALFELDDAEGPVREQVVRMEAEWRGFLAGLVSQAVAFGHLRADLDVPQFVWELCGIYLSHHASSRFLRQPDADTRAWTAFEALRDRGRAGVGTITPD